MSLSDQLIEPQAVQRVIDESHELDKKIVALCDFCATQDFHDLPEFDRGLLLTQNRLMLKLSDILRLRIRRFTSTEVTDV